MRVLLVGPGAVGMCAARALLAGDDLQHLTVAGRRDRDVATAVAALADERLVAGEAPAASLVAGHDVVVSAIPDDAASIVAAALDARAHAVVATDDPREVRDALALDGLAQLAGRSVLVGATMAPGLSCLLAGMGAERLDRVEQVHVASFGTGGPACARRHHAAFSGMSTDWYDREWRHRPAGSGRELVWFPEPVGGADCYRARLCDPELLLPAFPLARRVTARLAATRRDRFTAALPMLRPPHPEGQIGAVRVELRGWVGSRATSLVVGAVGRPALSAGLVAAAAARAAARGQLARSGAGGLARMLDQPGAVLREVCNGGVVVSVFDGAAAGEAGAGL